MKANLNFSLLLFCLGANVRAPWPLLLLLASLPPLAYVILCTWLVPGGFAWHRTTLDGHHPTPPGPVGWPLLGSIATMVRANSHRKLAGLAYSLGARRLMSFSLGPTRFVISSHPDTAREILSGHAFTDRPPKLAAGLLMFSRAIGFAPSGNYWRHLRQLASRNMFSPRRIASSEALRSRIAQEMTAMVENAMERRGVVELRRVLQWASLESIVSGVLGESMSAEEEEEVKEMVTEGYELISTFNLEDYIPLGGLLDFKAVGVRCKKLASRVKDLVSGIIKRRKSGHKGDDFLSILLTLPEEESLCESDMIAVLWEMIFRGADVVAILLEWAMARMVLHPDVQARVREEIQACVGPNRLVTDSDVPNLHGLQAVVKEVLRLHPPGPLLSWARLAIHDVQVGKMFVPAGTTAMVNMWAITHDGSIWEDPWAFKPERFLKEEVSVMGSDLRLSPFGSGRRVCPGRALGLATVHLWMARLLQHHAWLPNGPVQLAERLRLSLEMKKPLVCRAVRTPL